MFYTAFIHRAAEGGTYGISFPDVPGCIGAGDTFEEAVSDGAAALALHVEGLIEDGDEVPAPRDMAAILDDPALAEEREGAILVAVPLILDEGSSRRVNISLDAGLLRAIDAAARARGLNRSAFLASAARKEIEGVA